MPDLTDSASLDWAALMNAIAVYLGHGREAIPNVPTIWSAEQKLRIDDHVQSGYLQLLTPPPVRSGATSHDWRYLRPTTSIVAFVDLAVNSSVTVSNTTVTLTATAASFVSGMVGKTITITGVGDSVIASVTSSTVVVLTADPGTVSAKTFSIASNGDFQLPTDFGSIIGPLTYGPDAGYVAIDIHGEGDIRFMRQFGGSITGRPTIAAIRPKAVDATVEQLYELMLHPEPDANYTLSYQYRVLVNKLTNTNKYPVGGQPHAQTLLASCLAAAELAENDQRGPRWEYFIERLRASIDYDSQTAPEFIGHPSQPFTRRTPWHVHQSNIGSVTYVP